MTPSETSLEYRLATFHTWSSDHQSHASRLAKQGYYHVPAFGLNAVYCYSCKTFTQRENTAPELCHKSDCAAMKSFQASLFNQRQLAEIRAMVKAAMEPQKEAESKAMKQADRKAQVEAERKAQLEAERKAYEGICMPEVR